MLLLSLKASALQAARLNETQKYWEGVLIALLFFLSTANLLIEIYPILVVVLLERNHKTLNLIDKMAPTIPKLCGVKRSIFCTLVSVWGIIMLGVMGGLLSYKSIAFIEDIPVEEFEQHNGIENFYTEQDHKFDMAANNCYIAVVMYAVTFVVSIYHWAVYHKQGLV